MRKRFEIVYTERSEKILSGIVYLRDDGQLKQAITFTLTEATQSFSSNLRTTHRDVLKLRNNYYEKITKYLENVANFHFKQDYIWIG